MRNPPYWGRAGIIIAYLILRAFAYAADPVFMIANFLILGFSLVSDGWISGFVFLITPGFSGPLDSGFRKPAILFRPSGWIHLSNDKC